LLRNFGPQAGLRIGILLAVEPNTKFTHSFELSTKVFGICTHIYWSELSESLRCTPYMRSTYQVPLSFNSPDFVPEVRGLILSRDNCYDDRLSSHSVLLYYSQLTFRYNHPPSIFECKWDIELITHLLNSNQSSSSFLYCALLYSSLEVRPLFLYSVN